MVRLSGVALQLAGAWTAVVGLGKTSKLFDKDFGRDALRAWLAARPWGSKRVTVGTASVTLEPMEAWAQAISRIEIDTSLPIEEQMKTVQKWLNSLSNNVGALGRALHESDVKTRAALQAGRSEFGTRHNQIEEKLTEATAGGVPLGAVGIFWIISGTVFAGASPEISCLTSRFRDLALSLF